MHEVQRMRQELEQADKRVAYLEKLADEDSLVPVANRRAFVRELSRMVAYSERYNSVSSVLYFDIDGFKEINDKHGHAPGDAALQHIAEIFSLNVRESDVVGRLGGDEFGVILAQCAAAAWHRLQHIAEIFSLNVRESDVVGRLGGDEFGVILAQSDAAAAAEKAAGLAQAIETTPLIWQNKGLKVRASYGAYTFSGKENAGEALQRADSAMYKQKQVRAAAAGR